MKIEHMPSPSDALVSVVTLETDAERDLSDDQLMRICGNLQGLRYNHKLGAYVLNGKGFGPAVDGKVRRPEDSMVRIVQVPE